jgi:putative ATPase
MRPRSLDEFVGQDHLLAEGKFLANVLSTGRLPSIILWGPPGSGKTTLAGLLADAIDGRFVPLSAVSSGVRDIRKQAELAKKPSLFDGPTVLFVDEIHRFNKAQQDALLPHVEQGVLTLIGATTEPPSFEVNSALLSRCRVLTLGALDDAAVGLIVDRALSDVERGLGRMELGLEPSARATIIDAARGDARAALNALEVASDRARAEGRDLVARDDVEEAVQRRVVRYDKAGEEHYKTVSAFIKSMRGSDPDAALHYMVRMLEGGEDPLFVLRRMVIFASEDIGNADPRALQVAVSAMEAFRFMGMPEGVLPMTQAVTYLATAPKSNAVIAAYGKARKDVLQHGSLPIPKQIVNAPTQLHKSLGHGRGYKYPHNFDGNFVVEDYLPRRLRGQRYYEPTQNGYEAEITERLGQWRQAASEEE